jgi:hypothetical protein
MVDRLLAEIWVWDRWIRSRQTAADAPQVAAALLWRCEFMNWRLDVLLSQWISLGCLQPAVDGLKIRPERSAIQFTVKSRHMHSSVTVL